MKNKVIIKQASIGPLQVHTYLVVCPQTKNGVIIDPAGDEDRILSMIKDEDAHL